MVLLMSLPTWAESKSVYFLLSEFDHFSPARAEMVLKHPKAPNLKDLSIKLNPYVQKHLELGYFPIKIPMLGGLALKLKKIKRGSWLYCSMEKGQKDQFYLTGIKSFPSKDDLFNITSIKGLEGVDLGVLKSEYAKGTRLFRINIKVVKKN